MQTHCDPKSLIQRLHVVPFIDITGLQILHEVIGKLRKRACCSAKRSRTLAKLKNTKILDALGPGDYRDAMDKALAQESSQRELSD